jgi:hypothetical protein
MNFIVASFSGMVADRTNGRRRNRQPLTAAVLVYVLTLFTGPGSLRGRDDAT